MKTDLSTTCFQRAPEQPALKAGEVHVWRAWLDHAPSNAHELLATDEWARAGRFHFDLDRNHYIAGRAIVRSILAPYAGCDPRDLRLAVGPHGKPEIQESMLRFNLSHSGKLLLLAVTYGRELGVDVEEMRDGVSFEMLADHYFAAEDAWQLRLLPAEQRPARFYELWTRTEAQLKAGGEGLSNGAAVAEPGRWTLQSLTPTEGYVSALAVEGGNFRLQCWAWQNGPAEVMVNRPPKRRGPRIP